MGPAAWRRSCSNISGSPTAGAHALASDSDSVRLSDMDLVLFGVLSRV